MDLKPVPRLFGKKGSDRSTVIGDFVDFHTSDGERLEMLADPLGYHLAVNTDFVAVRRHVLVMGRHVLEFEVPHLSAQVLGVQRVG